LFADWFEAMSQKGIRAVTSRKKPTVVTHLRKLNNVGARERKALEDHA
jgi:hypothetical protein